MIGIKRFKARRGASRFIGLNWSIGPTGTISKPAKVVQVDITVLVDVSGRDTLALVRNAISVAVSRGPIGQVAIIRNSVGVAIDFAFV